MKSAIFKKLIIVFFIFSLVIAGSVYASWKFNPHTRKLDYYEAQVTQDANGNPLVGTSRVEVTTTSTLTDANVSQTLVTNYGMGSGGDTTLPAYSGSARCMVMTEAASQSWSLKPPSGEAFVLDGEALDADDEIDIGQSVGDTGTLIRIRTGASTYQWHFISVIGAHSDGGAS